VGVNLTNERNHAKAGWQYRYETQDVSWLLIMSSGVCSLFIAYLTTLLELHMLYGVEW
jgi:hypothetical protein